MQPFITLGLKGANHLIDQHWDKIPDKYARAETYKPRVLSKKDKLKNKADRARRTTSAPGRERDIEREYSSDEDEDSRSGDRGRDRGVGIGAGEDLDRQRDRGFAWEEEQRRRDMQRSYRDRDVAGIPEYSQDSPFINPPLAGPYSTHPPQERSRYVPVGVNSPPPVGGAYGVPPPATYGQWTQDGRRTYDNDRNEDYYSSEVYRPSRRPDPMRRRSSSYHGPRSRYHDDDDDSDYSDTRSHGKRALQRRDAGTGSEHLDRAKERVHRYGLKGEITDQFTKSKAGLGGAALGALAGGWAAQKGQVGYGKKGRKSEANPLLTLLGAAAGGLAANVLVEKVEEGKKDKEREKDSGSEVGSRRGRSERERERDRRSSRRDSRGYDSDGYD